MSRESPGSLSENEEDLYAVLRVGFNEQERFVFAEFVEWCAYARLAFEAAAAAIYIDGVKQGHPIRASNVAVEADLMAAEYVKRRDKMLVKLVELRKAAKP